jgi:hypothetical protein
MNVHSNTYPIMNVRSLGVGTSSMTNSLGLYGC